MSIGRRMATSQADPKPERPAAVDLGELRTGGQLHRSGLALHLAGDDPVCWSSSSIRSATSTRPSFYGWDGIGPGHLSSAPQLSETVHERLCLPPGTAQRAVLGPADDLSPDAPGLRDRLRADIWSAGSDSPAGHLLCSCHHLAGGGRHRLAADLQPLRRSAGRHRSGYRLGLPDSPRSSPIPGLRSSP